MVFCANEDDEVVDGDDGNNDPVFNFSIKKYGKVNVEVCIDVKFHDV